MKEQSTIDIGKKYEAIEKELLEGVNGKITNIYNSKSKEYFGDKTIFEDKDGFVIMVETDNGDEFGQFFNYPNARGLNQSNLYLFKNKYGSYPKINQIVKCKIDENGFYKVVF